MASRSLLAQRWLVAGALIGVTLSVFFVLRGYGPESAVRRFHEAVLHNQFKDAPEYVAVPRTAANYPQLVRYLSDLLGQATSYRVVRIDTNGKVAQTVVLYTLSSRTHSAMVWVVRQDDSGVWKVDPDGTATILKDSLGIR